MQKQTNIRNVGIVAHVDAGKTTTTEHMLFESGRIRTLGKVDIGTAQTDWLTVERERGISVLASSTSFEWKECRINLVDTPGHIDFSAEVERSLRVLDGAVLIVSAVEGVQAHTETLWHALQSMRIPTLIFVNKMDRVGADPVRVLEDIRNILTSDAVPLQVYSGTEANFESVAALRWNVKEAASVFGYDQSADRTEQANGAETMVSEPAGKEAVQALQEHLAERDEALLLSYLDGEEIGVQTWHDQLLRQVQQAELIPVLYGAASKGIGVIPLMDAIASLLPQPQGSTADPLSAVVYKLEQDKTMGKIAHVRVYNGIMHNRDAVRNATQNIVEKITQIRSIHGRSHEDIGTVSAGDIAAVCGLSGAKIGDILGDPEAVPKEHKLAVPLLTVRVHPEDAADYAALSSALQELSDEDPLLDLAWLQEERELHVKVMGPIQLEVLSSLLQERFGLAARFDAPTIIYKETLAAAGEGFVAYTMPKPCWAILRFHMEPGERGSGLHYRSEAKAERLMPSYQREVERRVPEALQQGMFGWEVTDVRITLVDGEHHVWHTHPLDFVVATPMGIMDGLSHIGTKLLEPMLHFRISVPEEAGGRVLSDLSQMRGVFDNPMIAGGRLQVEGRIPAASSLEYPITLGTVTGGRGTMTTRFDGYAEAPPDTKAERKRRGVNPLDRSKYILSVRQAMASD